MAGQPRNFQDSRTTWCSISLRLIQVTSCRRTLVLIWEEPLRSRPDRKGFEFKRELLRAAEQRPSLTVTTALRHRLRRNLFRHKRLDHVADFDVSVVRDRDTAFHAVGDLRSVVLEA